MRRKTVERILAVNPGATSTKFAVFEGETVLVKKTVNIMETN